MYRYNYVLNSDLRQTVYAYPARDLGNIQSPDEERELATSYFRNVLTEVIDIHAGEIEGGDYICAVCSVPSSLEVFLVQ